MARKPAGSKGRKAQRNKPGTTDDIREDLRSANTEWTTAGETGDTFFSKAQDYSNTQQTLRGMAPKSSKTFRRGRIWA